jgi:hypothetical protein
VGKGGGDGRVRFQADVVRFTGDAEGPEGEASLLGPDGVPAGPAMSTVRACVSGGGGCVWRQLWWCGVVVGDGFPAGPAMSAVRA